MHEYRSSWATTCNSVPPCHRINKIYCTRSCQGGAPYSRRLTHVGHSSLWEARGAGGCDASLSSAICNLLVDSAGLGVCLECCPQNGLSAVSLRLASLLSLRFSPPALCTLKLFVNMLPLTNNVAVQAGLISQTMYLSLCRQVSHELS
jgi:hypothetical protein